MRRRYCLGLALLGLALSASTLAGDDDDGAWFHALTRVGWQVKDAGLAAQAVADTAARSVEAGRPVAFSALRGDVAALDKHLARLDRRLAELEALPIPEGPAPSAE